MPGLYAIGVQGATSMAVGWRRRPGGHSASRRPTCAAPQLSSFSSPVCPLQRDTEPRHGPPVPDLPATSTTAPSQRARLPDGGRNMYIASILHSTPLGTLAASGAAVLVRFDTYNRFSSSMLQHMSPPLDDGCQASNGSRKVFIAVLDALASTGPACGNPSRSPISSSIHLTRSTCRTRTARCLEAPVATSGSNGRRRVLDSSPAWSRDPTPELAQLSTTQLPTGPTLQNGPSRRTRQVFV